MKKIKKQGNKGITLIALVITIIVLLILAGVSIVILTGDNGLLTKANEAKEANDKAEEKELIQLAYQAAIIEKYKNGEGTKTFEEILEEELEANGIKGAVGTNNEDGSYTITLENGNSYIIDEKGNITESVKGPKVTYTTNPEQGTQVAEGQKIIITITATATEGTITKITKPDGTTVENMISTTYEVEENGDYKFIVEQSNGGKTTYVVKITNGKEVEKFSEIYTKNTKITQGDKIAWVPAGFAVGKSSTIDEIEEGLVITDAIDENHRSIGNEFVWVPVNFSEFKREHFGTESQKWWTGAFATDAPSEKKIYEPVADGIANTTEVEKMYKSIKDNGGFYIGRYEAGNDGENVVVKKNQPVYNNITWGNSIRDETGGAVEKARNFIKNGQTEQGNETTVTSTLCYGVQWDAVMRWMKDEPNIDDPSKKYVQDSTGMGWYDNNYSSGNPDHKTGIDLIGENGIIKNKIRNIYDMAGNVIEWTMEDYGNWGRVYRGGNYENSGSSYPASGRYGYNYPDFSASRVGFRPTLYL